MWVWVWFVACQSKTATIETTIHYDKPAQETVESAEEPFQSLLLTPMTMDLVQAVQWTSDGALRTRAVFETEEGRVYATPWSEDASVEGEHQLIGIPASSSFSVYLEGESVTGIVQSETLTGETNPLPSDLVTPTLQAGEYGQTTGFAVLPLISLDTQYLVILDGDGNVVWHLPQPLWSFRARMNLAHTAILNLDTAQNIHDNGVVRKNELGTLSIQEIEAPGIHTDFVEISEGRFAAPSWVIEEVIDDDGVHHSLLGDRVLVFGQDEEPVELWNVFDHFVPDMNREWLSGWYTADDSVKDWSHLNGIDYEEEEDALYLSLAGLEAIVKIDVQTGEQHWAMLNASSEGSDFSSAERLISFPHGVQGLEGDSILLFNRAGVNSDCSQAVEIDYDPGQGTAERVWVYESAECFQVFYAGTCERLSNENTLIAWSTSGTLDQVNEEGELVWRLGWPAGVGFGFANWYDSLY